ncbi:hypothetical protein F5883DRAFT_540559 [Diaporthe sp. PMI_573]|nr:hypothetical protein F5883DRAFT_540559 [Diaporthaceae sp. PMI_573]
MRWSVVCLTASSAFFCLATSRACLCMSLSSSLPSILLPFAGPGRSLGVRVSLLPGGCWLLSASRRSAPMPTRKVAKSSMRFPSHVVVCTL